MINLAALKKTKQKHSDTARSHTYTTLLYTLMYSLTYCCTCMQANTASHTHKLCMIWSARRRAAMKPAALPLAGTPEWPLWAGPSLLPQLPETLPSREVFRETLTSEKTPLELNTLTSVSERSSACCSQTSGVCRRDSRERPFHRLCHWHWMPGEKMGFHTQTPGQSASAPTSLHSLTVAAGQACRKPVYLTDRTAPGAVTFYSHFTCKPNKPGCLVSLNNTDRSHKLKEEERIIMRNKTRWMRQEKKY